ncbi:transferase [Alloacidobacterium dinghuense]|uniref:Transferase n=1 Tax=Alloacidobacterium dinghuense TaxID=2763107 RepID=A0A7G8BPS9_9BACT|nr:methyltransferase [Alloacidobacterium dinghuense]QNI34549.1 transferase [Alloacidobacterium dinghuense]
MHKKTSRHSHPRIYQDGDCISLEFANGEIQSQMLMSDPNHLVLTYTRAMMAFSFFHQKPERIAIIGLGGGSVVKWCYQNHPDAGITVIEINPDVISSREQFLIPPDDHRLRVIEGDGADYVANTKDRTEVLLVDGFDAYGQSPQLCSPAFYKNCYRALAPDGLMVVNLCGPEDQGSIDNIRNAFHGRTVIAIPDDGENQLVFAFKGKRSQGEILPAEELSEKLRDYVLIPVQIQ